MHHDKKSLPRLPVKRCRKLKLFGPGFLGLDLIFETIWGERASPSTWPSRRRGEKPKVKVLQGPMHHAKKMNKMMM
jgi:hypothetical protein